MRTISYYIAHPRSLCSALLHTFFSWLPDIPYVKLRYWFEMGKKLRLKHPVTFQDKLQWLKLYDHNPNYTKMVDKVLVKDYVSSIVGSEYVTPLLGVWDKVEDIDWGSLPNRFVLKTNHSGGNTGVVICRDKNLFDKNLAIAKLNKSLKHDLYKDLREWPYKNVKKKVFAEAYIEDEYGELRDYKFFCFNGEVKALFIATDRQNPNEDVKFDFFNEDFIHLPIRQGHANAKVPPSKPKSFEEMKKIAAALSKGIPHVRVDMYEVNGRPVFGELTFCHFAGMVPFEPEDWDYIFGEWLTLPE